MSSETTKTDLVLYDGVCGLCNATVRFLLARDRRGVLTFAPLQGETAARLQLEELTPGDLDTLIFVEHFGAESQRISIRSTGVLRILGRIGGVWRVVSWLRVIPAPIRDLVYRGVARFRYRWFGKLDSCQMPSPQVRNRFLD